MKEPQQQTLQIDDEATLVVSGEETTLVAPRFDDEETLVARPVVPLEGGEPAPAPEREAALPSSGYRRPFAPRRSGMLALALTSVLIGGVLGGAGLYLYQRQSHAPAVSPTATTQPETPADATQATAAPNAEPAVQQTEAPAAAAAPQVEESPAPARVAEVPAAVPARERESVTATERRTTSTDGGTPKRGKKGERDEETEQRDTPRPDANVARTDEREARRVDTIFYRQRRAARRARRDDNVDRLRRIFEGTPQ
ncbi:MAG: hypothetical protein ACJ74T_16975 [Pyrinomonadaceae bacterium]